MRPVKMVENDELENSYLSIIYRLSTELTDAAAFQSKSFVILVDEEHCVQVDNCNSHSNRSNEN
jgi:hypothetical protein